MDMKDLITKGMIEHFNLKMKDEGSCLRIIENGGEGGIIHYKLTIIDKYTNFEYSLPPLTEECEVMVRAFFDDYGIKLPFRNQVYDIWAYKIGE